MRLRNTRALYISLCVGLTATAMSPEMARACRGGHNEGAPSMQQALAPPPGSISFVGKIVESEVRHGITLDVQRRIQGEVPDRVLIEMTSCSIKRQWGKTGDVIPAIAERLEDGSYVALGSKTAEWPRQ